MSRGAFYLGLVVAAITGLVAILLFPEPTTIILTACVPIAIAGAVVATTYTVRVYRSQPIPRSRFFGIVLELFYALVLLGVWVGYLTVARLLERAGLGWSIPAPPPTYSSPISAVVVLLVFTFPVRFALEIFRVRRRGAPPPGAGGERDLDRVDAEE